MFCSTACGLFIAFVIGLILYGRKQADAEPEKPSETAEPAAEPAPPPAEQVPPTDTPQSDPLPPVS